MDMLEEVQRQRPRAIEQQAVALLQIVEIAAGEVVDQPMQLGAFGRRQDGVAVDHLADFVGCRDEVGGRVGKQCGQGPERLHHTTSIGFLARSLPPEKRLPPLSPDEQPLPKLKPQAPRSW